MSNDNLNKGLNLVTCGCVGVLFIPLGFAGLWLLSNFLHPDLTSMPNQYGTVTSRWTDIPVAILLVSILVVVWLISNSQNNKVYDVPYDRWIYTYEHHYINGEVGYGTRKDSSWTEGWDGQVPVYFSKAVKKLENTNPWKQYDDALIVRSWIEDTGSKAIIHDGVLTYRIMAEVGNAKIADQIKSNGTLEISPAFKRKFELMFNQVSDWRIRK
jgi:hypothetical protein